MIQQMLPVLVNCSRLLPLEVTASHVSEKMHRIQYSGYNQRIRYEVLSSAFKACERLTSEITSYDSGEMPMNRTRDWHGEERGPKKEERKRMGQQRWV